MPSDRESALDTLLVSCQDSSMAFSASRISTWMQCPTKAGWEYICGYRAPPTGATDKGSQVHAVLEQLRKEGLLPDRTTEIGAIAAEALPYLPDFGENESVEAYFSFQPGRHEWCGYKDLELPGLVLDYKTTSDFKYAKTPEDLLYDPQAILYAHHYFTCHPDAATVDLCWLYLKSRKPYEARPVTLTMTREWAAAGFAALESYADEMATAVAAAPTDPVERHKHVLSLAKNESQCDAYGGCPHQARCNISMFRERNREVKPVNLLERLSLLTGGSPPAPTPAALTTTIAMAPSSLVTTMTASPVPALSVAVGGGMAVGPDPLFAELAASLNRSPSEFVGGGGDGGGGSKVGTGTNGRPDFAALAAASPVVPTQGNPHPLGADLDQPAVDAAVAAAEGINPPKRGRGRPRKDTIPAPTLEVPPIPRTIGIADEAHPMRATAVPAINAAIEKAVLNGVVIPPVVALGTTTPALSRKHEPADVAQLKAAIDAISGARPSHKIGTLYVGCMVVGHHTASLDDILLQAREMIGPAAYFGGYGYKTNGMVSEAVQKIVDARGHIPALFVADGRLPEAALVLSYLRANSATVIEALR